MIDFLKAKHIHFLGVGGVSMSSLALFFHKKGIHVTGTDEHSGGRLCFLAEQGISVWTGFLPQKTGKPDICVFSSAISTSDIEKNYLLANRVPCLERFELLGFLSDYFSYTVSIAGTHGKSTVSAMISHVLHQSSFPLFSHVGATCPSLGDFLYTGNDFFITEACEYRKSFLALHSDISVVLNVEPDHPDTYPTKKELYDAFSAFITHTKRNGCTVLNGDSDFYKENPSLCNLITFGKSPYCTYRMTDIFSNYGYYGCRIDYLGTPFCTISLPIMGEYNLYNATACVAVCGTLKVPVPIIEKSLSTFSGAERRFEYKGLFCGASVYIDYAHHPTEIRETIRLARSLLCDGATLFVVFQPHTFSRTKALFDDFVSSLSDADVPIIVKEYSARETKEMGVDAQTLFRALPSLRKRYCENIVDTASFLVKETAPKDFILILGAGNIDTLANILTKK